jgi:hypothetical protein
MPDLKGCCSGSAPGPLSLTLLTVLAVFSGNERIRITLLPARPSRPNAIFDTERPKKCLRATQVAGEGAGIFRPTGAVLRDTITAAFNAVPQKIGGATRPGGALAHELAPRSRASSTADPIVACTRDAYNALSGKKINELVNDV